MQIQTLSIVVPTPRCINNCAFCVSKMANDKEYPNQIEKNVRFFDLYEADYIKRMQFARDNGCNTIILTGDGEPLQNKAFLKNFAHWNASLRSPFQWIELQTSGVMLNDEALRFLRNTVGVTTISVSISDMFFDMNNNKIIGTPPNYPICLDDLTLEIKRYDFNLRLSINLITVYDSYTMEEIFKQVKNLRADQVIFRKLYSDGAEHEREFEMTPEAAWVKNNACNQDTLAAINQYILNHGTALEKLPFGATRYDVDGISAVLDDNCMPQETTDVFRYLVLRSNCKLYSRWDRKASLIF